MEEDIIIKAIRSLYNSINSSTLGENEKNGLRKLLDKIITYYQEELKEISKCQCGYNLLQHRRAFLISRMTDYIVAINDTIHSLNDVYSIINMIYKEINYDDTKGKFKRKRLIR